MRAASNVQEPPAARRAGPGAAEASGRRRRVRRTRAGRQAKKGAWRMPRLSQARKDAVSCENPGLGANSL